MTAVIHHMVSPSTDHQGLVVGIDHLPGLTDLSKRNLHNDGIELGKGIEIVTGDGRNGTLFRMIRFHVLIRSERLGRKR